jgi:hypothetical protein
MIGRRGPNISSVMMSESSGGFSRIVGSMLLQNWNHGRNCETDTKYYSIQEWPMIRSKHWIDRIDVFRKLTSSWGPCLLCAQQNCSPYDPPGGHLTY